MLLERYEVGRLLGMGGMAEVFEGRDRLLARRVAIKVPLSQYAHDPEFAQRFRRGPGGGQPVASRGGRHLRHRRRGGTHFIVMEYVDGRTLKDVIRAEAPLYPAGRPRSPPTSARPWPRPTPAAWSTGTSSRPTSCSCPTAG